MRHKATRKMVYSIAHFRLVHNQVQDHSNGYKYYFQVKENLYPYKWFCTWPRFEKEAKSNSEMGYSFSMGLMKQKKARKKLTK